MILNRTRYTSDGKQIFDTEEFETMNQVHNYMSSMFEQNKAAHTYRREENKSGTKTWELFDITGNCFYLLKYTNI